MNNNDIKDNNPMSFGIKVVNKKAIWYNNIEPAICNINNIDV